MLLAAITPFNYLVLRCATAVHDLLSLQLADCQEGTGSLYIHTAMICAPTDSALGLVRLSV